MAFDLTLQGREDEGVASVCEVMKTKKCGKIFGGSKLLFWRFYSIFSRGVVKGLYFLWCSGGEIVVLCVVNMEIKTP
jgi:hypothetical protein